LFKRGVEETNLSSILLQLVSQARRQVTLMTFWIEQLIIITNW
jgi:hypothetical protein